MRLVHRLAATTAAAVSVLALSGATTAASAADQPGQLIGSASVAVTEPAAKGVQEAGGNCNYEVSCTKLSNGTLYVGVYQGTNFGNDIHDTFEKTGGGTITARFAYNAGHGTLYDQGAFTQSAGQTKYFRWQNQTIDYCAQVVGILDVTGQGSFQTPPVYMC
ncbi:hypothetical protein [Kitasatospora sp. CB01950]|uniref:hypothetical protein n=1 Tax=Kitasatospora sp. CB01950 TaxID=1703930 RepID=UPI00093F64F6|nr:hypothetical protein [Kitasatospora sp. CB01950]